MGLRKVSQNMIFGSDYASRLQQAGFALRERKPLNRSKVSQSFGLSSSEDLNKWFTLKKNREIVKDSPYHAEFLEYWISNLYINQMKFQTSGHRILIEGAPEGGDYDVISFSQTDIVHTECKSGNPAGISAEEIKNTIKRGKYINSNINILYCDTSDLSTCEHFINTLRSMANERGSKIGKLTDHTSARVLYLDNFSIYLVSLNGKDTPLDGLRLAVRANKAFKRIVSSSPFPFKVIDQLYDDHRIISENL